ncbi:hypothetical protein DITRI_Ditri16bG0062500 [Diplodiscus trichospermus]
MGEFICCRTSCRCCKLSAKEGEVLGLLEALAWVRGLGDQHVIFELDAKGMVDVMKGGVGDVIEFGCMARESQSHFNTMPNFRIAYVRRQANEIGHVLAKFSRFYASPMDWDIIPSRIVELLSVLSLSINE